MHNWYALPMHIVCWCIHSTINTIYQAWFLQHVIVKYNIAYLLLTIYRYCIYIYDMSFFLLFDTDRLHVKCRSVCNRNGCIKRSHKYYLIYIYIFFLYSKEIRYLIWKKNRSKCVQFFLFIYRCCIMFHSGKINFHVSCGNSTNSDHLLFGHNCEKIIQELIK